MGLKMGYLTREELKTILEKVGVETLESRNLSESELQEAQVFFNNMNEKLFGVRTDVIVNKNPTRLAMGPRG